MHGRYQTRTQTHICKESLPKASGRRRIKHAFFPPFIIGRTFSAGSRVLMFFPRRFSCSLRFPYPRRPSSLTPAALASPRPDQIQSGPRQRNRRVYISKCAPARSTPLTFPPTETSPETPSPKTTRALLADRPTGGVASWREHTDNNGQELEERGTHPRDRDVANHAPALGGRAKKTVETRCGIHEQPLLAPLAEIRGGGGGQTHGFSSSLGLEN